MAAKILQEVAELTGLPEAPIKNELQTIITQAGFNSESLTLEELREALSSYLQDVLLELQSEHE